MRHRERLLFGTFLAGILAAGPTIADTPLPPSGTRSLQAIAPIFSQLLAWHMPLRFHGVNEESRGNFYMLESVPHGETVDQWSRMITITGLANAATNPDLTPRSYATGIAAGFQKACPDSFSASALDSPTVDGHATFAAIMSCGRNAQGAGAQSETAVVLVIKGTQDYYTVQWAEHGQAQSAPLQLDAAKWSQRLGELLPIHICEKLPGETSPFPSCLKSISASSPKHPNHP